MSWKTLFRTRFAVSLTWALTCSLLAVGLPAKAQESDLSTAPDPSASERQESTAQAPQTAQQATEIEAVAKPVPISPSPADPLRPAFQLYAEYDLPVLSIGAVFAASRLVLLQKAYCAPLCDKSELNPLDRQTAGRWSPAWQLTSNLVLGPLAAGAGLLLMIDEGFLNGLNDSVVIAESALAAMATVSVMTLATSRPRPFLYGEDAPLGKRNSSDAGLSFLSSHAAVAFSVVTSSFMTLRRLHPRGKLPFLVLGIGAGLALAVATARVMGGMHFITDAAGGAIVGTSMGVLVPALHRSPVRVAPSAGAAQLGVSLVGAF